MVHAIRRTEQMLGSEAKIIDPAEEELRNFARRGVQALQQIHKGDILKEGLNMAILRPGNQPQGIYPRYIKEIEGHKAVHDIKMGQGIQVGDWL